MTDLEFNQIRSEAFKKEFSPYAKWMFKLRDYVFLDGVGDKVPKFIIWEDGYRDIDLLLNNKSPYSCHTQREYKKLLGGLNRG